MSFCLEISGDFACFTRPEMKVERVSYDVITPSAARSIFEAILWKPAIEWHIHKIEILKPIKWVNLRRNEVSSVFPANKINSAQKGGELPSLFIDENKNRQQRAGLFLKDVAYRIHGSFQLTAKAGSSDNAGKFSDMFKRRAKKGQCFNQPYLGCREFSCNFRLVENVEQEVEPFDISSQLGWMLYDMDFSDKNNPQPLFYNPKIIKGTIHVPSRISGEVIG